MVQQIKFMTERAWLSLQVLFQKSKRLVGMADENKIAQLQHRLDTLRPDDLRTAPDALGFTADALSKVFQDAVESVFGIAAPAKPPAAGDAPDVTKDMKDGTTPDDKKAYTIDVDPPWAKAMVRGSQDAYSLLVNAQRAAQQKEADWLKKIWEKTRRQNDLQEQMRDGINEMASHAPVRLATIEGLA